jgi:ABC-type Zn2+ transport system substrate-binding protein/surface adhesin
MWLSAINHYTGHGVPLRIVEINPLSLHVTEDKLQGLHAETNYDHDDEDDDDDADDDEDDAENDDDDYDADDDDYPPAGRNNCEIMSCNAQIRIRNLEINS